MLPYRYQTRQLTLARDFIKCEFVVAQQFALFILKEPDILEETQIFFCNIGVNIKKMFDMIGVDQLIEVTDYLLTGAGFAPRFPLAP